MQPGPWIDSHCHLDAPEFDADRDSVLARARAAGVGRLVLPAVRARDFDAVRGLAHAHGLAYALGLHPLYVGEAAAGDLDRLAEALRRHRDDPHLVAVGEIGLDHFVPGLDRALQTLERLVAIPRGFARSPLSDVQPDGPLSQHHRICWHHDLSNPASRIEIVNSLLHMHGEDSACSIAVRKRVVVIEVIVHEQGVQPFLRDASCIGERYVRRFGLARRSRPWEEPPKVRGRPFRVRQLSEGIVRLVGPDLPSCVLLRVLNDSYGLYSRAVSVVLPTTGAHLPPRALGGHRSPIRLGRQTGS